MPTPLETLCDLLVARRANVGVIGLGYVGLPLMCALCAAGFTATGFDIDPEKIDKLQRGQSYIGNIHNDRIRGFVQAGLFHPTADFSRLSGMDTILLCVPTPLADGRAPDMSYIVATAEQVARHLRRGQLVVLESTTYPGTTRDLVRPMLENASGLRAGDDFFLAFSPEREDPGNAVHTTVTIPKIVGGVDAASQAAAQTLYSQFLQSVVPVANAETAEAAKLTENIFRAVNIALVNELKVIYAAMGIDIWEVIAAAKTKPFGYMPFYPGPGLGGHCIPIDPFYLTWKAAQLGIDTQFIRLAGDINVAMPSYVVDRLAEALAARASTLAGARILLLGAAYKKNVADIRESPFFSVMEILRQRGAEVAFHDPHVPTIPMTREHAECAGLVSTPLTPEILTSISAAVIITDHDNIDYDMILRHAPLIVDTRNVLAAAPDRTRIVKA